MTIKIRLLYSDDGFAFRHASTHVVDPRDLARHGGQRPPGFLPEAEPIVAAPGEVEFDHEPTEEELAAAFPNRAARLRGAL